MRKKIWDRYIRKDKREKNKQIKPKQNKTNPKIVNSQISLTSTHQLWKRQQKETAKPEIVKWEKYEINAQRQVCSWCWENSVKKYKWKGKAVPLTIFLVTTVQEENTLLVKFFPACLYSVFTYTCNINLCSTTWAKHRAMLNSEILSAASTFQFQGWNKKVWFHDAWNSEKQWGWSQCWVPALPQKLGSHITFTVHWDWLSKRLLLVPFQPLATVVGIPPWKNPSQILMTCWPAALIVISPLACIMCFPTRCHRCFCKSHGFWLKAFNKGPSFRQAFTLLVGDSPPNRDMDKTLSVGDLHQNALTSL